MQTLFEFDSYQKYFQTWLLRQPKNGRGLQRELAERTGVQASFLNQVLRKRAHLNQEQAFALSRELALDETETEFFLLLVQKARTSDSNHKKFIERKLTRLREERLNLRTRIQSQASLSSEQMSAYFSSWTFVAVHLACMTNQYHSLEKIVARFGLTLEQATEHLNALQKMGLIQKTLTGYAAGQAELVVPEDSPYRREIQMHLKTKVLDVIQRGSKGLHYVSAVTLSAKDAQMIQQRLIHLVEELRPKIHDSPAEEVFLLNLDFSKI